MHDLTLGGAAPLWRLVPVGVLACVALALFTANPLLTATSIIGGYTVVRLLWRIGEPPVLLFAVAYQWLQGSILVFYADAQHLPIEESGLDRWRSAAQIEEAVWITLGGLLVMALGMRAVMRCAPQSVDLPAQAVASPVRIDRLFYANLIAIALSGVLAGASQFVAGLSEPVRALILLRWGVYFLLAYAVFTQRRGYRALAIVFAIEVGIGFLGFFSDFKTVLVMTFLAAAAVPELLRGRMKSLVAISFVAICLTMVWSAIKKDYREFLNQGTTGQVILVSKADQVLELGRQIADLTPESILDGAEQLMYRISYVDFLAATLETVPGVIPHEKGKLWYEAFQHVVTPRLLNPFKPVINDSDRTREYSGISVSGGEEGTSVSLGYIAETYIDFGRVLMFPALFVLGTAIAWAYRFVVRSLQGHPFAYGCAAALIVQSASVLEQTNLKLLGGMVVGVLVLYLVQRYLGLKMLRLLIVPTRK